MPCRRPAGRRGFFRIRRRALAPVAVSAAFPPGGPGQRCAGSGGRASGRRNLFTQKSSRYERISTAAPQRPRRGRHLRPRRPGVHDGVWGLEADQLRARRSLHHRSLSRAHPAPLRRALREPQPRAGGGAGGDHRLRPCGSLRRGAGAGCLPASAQGQPAGRRRFRARRVHRLSERGHAHLRRAGLRLSRKPHPLAGLQHFRAERAGDAHHRHCQLAHAHARASAP